MAGGCYNLNKMENICSEIFFMNILFKYFFFPLATSGSSASSLHIDKSKKETGLRFQRIINIRKQTVSEVSSFVGNPVH